MIDKKKKESSINLIKLDYTPGIGIITYHLPIKYFKYFK